MIVIDIICSEGVHGGGIEEGKLLKKRQRSTLLFNSLPR